MKDMLRNRKHPFIVNLHAMKGMDNKLYSKMYNKEEKNIKKSVIFCLIC